ncbi:MAG: hypothetical protein C3F13_15370 [Anaerolineales bacterium]|nr:MAG: hypothetical protein C3F13_15370 [Anaerolineales bacterium]
MMKHWYLGTIGFSYKEWVGPFYPAGTTARDYLPYYSKIFNALELDTTFHSIPPRASVEGWNNTVPLDFKFCPKTPRSVTHELRLKGAEGIMAEFLDALSPIKQKLGPILIQLPPSFRQENYPILQNFLEALPHTYRYAVEFRHASWYNDKTTELLRRHQVGWVAVDFPKIPRKIIPTTDFMFLRWIGVNGMYQGHSYERIDTTGQLHWWLQAMQEFYPQIPVVYGFFNNDYAGYAAGTCQRFMLLAGLIDPSQDLPYQERLF